MHEIEHDDPDMLAKMRYESRDWSGRQVTNFVVIMLIFAGIGGFISFGIWLAVNPGIMSQDITGPKIAKQPPENYPVLQTNITAKTDIEMLRKAEKEKLEKYKVDPNSATVQVPVDRAVDYYLANGGNK